MKRVIAACFYAWFAVISVDAETIALPRYFKAHFAQTVTSPDGAVIRYEGDVHFAQPSRLKWLYRHPTRKEVCTDGQDVLVVDHELEQVSRYRLRKRFDLAAVLRRAKHHRGRIYVAEYEGRRYTLRLDARGRLESVAFYDDADNKVQLLFTRMRVSDKPSSQDRLQCDYPTDYDLIEG